MMSTARDYYEILGIPKGSGVDEVKRAYRKLVMKCHPDRVAPEKKKEAEEKFKEISEAYAVLSDSKKKQLYDQYGHAGIDARYTTEDIFKGADFSSIFGGGFGDIFENLFSGFGSDAFSGSTGAARGRYGTRVGEDTQLQLLISLEEASSGTEEDVAFSRYDSCLHCNGSGAEPGSSKITCSTCGGQGAVRSGMGFISFSQTCPTCQGEGKIIKNSCRQCSGRGRVKSKKTLKVNIPKGVDTGSILRLRGEGNFAGEGRGDLFLHIKVRNHPVFAREGDDVKCKIKISIFQAILGTEIEVPVLNGKAMMKIPAGTQPNTVFRLKGKGIVSLRTKQLGDELIEVEIDVPRKLSSKERKLFMEIAKLRNEL